MSTDVERASSFICDDCRKKKAIEELDKAMSSRFTPRCKPCASARRGSYRTPPKASPSPQRKVTTWTRTCWCGTVLSRSNASSECHACTRLRMDAELLNDVRAKQVIAARKVIDVYLRPANFTCSEEYRHGLGVALDEMCLAMNLPILEAEVPWTR